MTFVFEVELYECVDNDNGFRERHKADCRGLNFIQTKSFIIVINVVNKLRTVMEVSDVFNRYQATVPGDRG